MDTKFTDNGTTEFNASVAIEKYAPSGVYEVVIDNAGETIDDSADIFDEDGLNVGYNKVPGYPNLEYVPFGADNMLPYRLVGAIASDDVLSQNLFFNILTTYGTGLQYLDKKTKKPTEDESIKEFMLHNSMSEFFLEQCTDMKYYFFSVAVIILSNDYKRIVQVRHKDASFCRFQRANSDGVIEHLFYANWRKESALTKKTVEKIRLLDQRDPLGDLLQLVGRAPGRDGVCRLRTNEHKFAVVMRFPTPGQKYYPTPYYTSIFRGDWFDIKRLVGRSKKMKIRNSSAWRYQVEINKEYWQHIINEENLVDPLEIKKRFEKEKQNIRDFITGSRNSGKVWISGFYTDLEGKEHSMVRINTIDTTKQGGDWSEDVAEASNMECYVTNIHPNLVGATPGKSSTNNSGSDKRELFTLKQSLECAFHDMLCKVHNLIIYYNGWESKVTPAVPLILLTTLDKNKDAQKVQRDGTESDVND